MVQRSQFPHYSLNDIVTSLWIIHRAHYDSLAWVEFWSLEFQTGVFSCQSASLEVCFSSYSTIRILFYLGFKYTAKFTRARAMEDRENIDSERSVQENVAKDEDNCWSLFTRQS